MIEITAELAMNLNRTNPGLFRELAPEWAKQNFQASIEWRQSTPEYFVGPIKKFTTKEKIILFIKETFNGL